MKPLHIEYVRDTDVLVIGGGAAGLRAAAAAAKVGVSVLICSKSLIGQGGSTFMNESIGMSAVTHPELGDSEEHYLEEILDAGAGAADPELARILAENATLRFQEMEEEGVAFRKDENGNYHSGVPCFGKRIRGANAKTDSYRDYLCKNILRSNIDFLVNTTVMMLVLHEGCCCGAVGLDKSDQFVFFRAKAVILATGGACSIFRNAHATFDLCGDGYIMAYKAGAPLVNLEFIQFGPTMLSPVYNGPYWNKALLSYPSMTNRLGEEIIPKYLPKNIPYEKCIADRVHDDPFSTANSGCYVDVAMYEEWCLGNACDSGGIRLRYDRDRVENDASFATKDWLERLRAKNIDIFGEGIDVLTRPFAFNGGIHIDKDAGARVPGLFAAGETASGPHGADRLGGNALAATQVFGKIAGESAAKYAKRITFNDIDIKKVESDFMLQFDTGGSLINLQEAIDEVKDIMWRNAALSRSEERCKTALLCLREIESRFNPYQHFTENVQPRQAFALYSYLELAQIMLNIIDFRKESRGSHFRIDYPVRNEKYRGYIKAQNRNGKLQLKLKRQK